MLFFSISLSLMLRMHPTVSPDKITSWALSQPGTSFHNAATASVVAFREWFFSVQFSMPFFLPSRFVGVAGQSDSPHSGPGGFTKH